MVALKKLVRQKMKASTMLEVIIAMVLIMAVFGIAMMIFTNVTASSLSSRKLKAATLANDALIKMEHSGKIENTSYVIDGTTVTIKVEQSERAGMVRVTATVSREENEPITARKKMMLLSNE